VKGFSGSVKEGIGIVIVPTLLGLFFSSICSKINLEFILSNDLNQTVPRVETSNSSQY
jgi:hypothetical protein